MKTHEDRCCGLPHPNLFSAPTADQCPHTFTIVATDPNTGETKSISFTPALLARMDVTKGEWTP